MFLKIKTMNKLKFLGNKAVRMCRSLSDGLILDTVPNLVLGLRNRTQSRTQSLNY